VEIKVLGTGCAKCKLLYRAAEEAIARSGRTANLTRVEAIEEIMRYGVMTTPALLIDGRVVFAGRVPAAGEIATVISESAAGDRP
jgi:small redox-active disulfide protein 2